MALRIETVRLEDVHPIKDEYGNEHHIGAMYGSQRIPVANQETE